MHAEPIAATNFSFLSGASHPGDMVETAIAQGLSGIGIADRNSVAGVVRAWSALKEAREEGRGQDFKLITGARLVFADGTPDIIAYPKDRAAWGRLVRLLSIGNLRAEKGQCELRFDDLLEWGEGMALIVLPATVIATHGLIRGKQSRLIGAVTGLLRSARNDDPNHLWIGASMPRGGRDKRHLAALKSLSAETGIPLIATNDALYASPESRPLADILTCIREKTTIEKAGRLLSANAERHLKDTAEMARLFRDCPEALAEVQHLFDAVQFDLSQLSYEYPHEPCPPGYTPQNWLIALTRTKAAAIWPDGVPGDMQSLLDEELTIVGRLNYAPYFLTVHDIVAWAQGQGILCQGRGSAANSAICFVLGITAVDPAKHSLLFSRFISEERKEPPDIDVDFEHERREEVMQYVYRRYGRHRAGIVATVIHYRPRSTIREVGKALGLTEDVTARLSSTVWGSHSGKVNEARFEEGGFDPEAPEIVRMTRFCRELLGFPRHLSQHVGGFVLTQDRLDETVPILNAAMADRTFIAWDKDDIDALGLMKVDVLALGMLTCIRKAFEMLGGVRGVSGTLDCSIDAIATLMPASVPETLLTLSNIPDDDPAVWDMLEKGDSIGVFQVESRAQINMLPRMKPRCFYDLAIQVAIVRPGPIQGDMVHPYLRRRQGREKVVFPSPAPPHDPHELRGVLGKTLGVPLFQEQAMKLAIVAAEFTPSESNQLRRAMATFRNLGKIQEFQNKLVNGMVRRGYQAEFAERCFKQIEGFGSYGFPESHAIAFARLVWVSSWIKCHYPAVFAAALLNSQPMGFYAPAQIVRDAREHGVDVRSPDVNESGWDNDVSVEDARPVEDSVSGTLDCSIDAIATLMPASVPETAILILGLRQIDGFREVWADAIAANRPYASLEELARKAALPSRALRLLADADALRSLGQDRREGAWDVLRDRIEELPLFAAARRPASGTVLGTSGAAGTLEGKTVPETGPGLEPAMALPTMMLGEHVAADYQTIRLSLKSHPLAILRDVFVQDGIKTAAEISATRNGARAKMAGIVLVRQRPGNGKAIFLTLEDETGVTNVIMWERTFERYRRAVMACRLMEVQGEVQKSPEGVVHLLAHQVVDRTDALALLSEIHKPEITLSRADEFLHPQQLRQKALRAGHPRNVRTIPKSRDFH
jgi:error-prone DNA polymerase